MKLHVFKINGYWFYEFNYRWSVYRANQGYDSKESATSAGQKHIDAQEAK
jgi:hypothetical protein